MARIARHTGQAPSLIATLTQTVIDQSVFQSLEKLLNAEPLCAKNAESVLEDLGNNPSIVLGTRRMLLEDRNALDDLATKPIPQHKTNPEYRQTEHVLQNIHHQWAHDRYLAGVIDYVGHFLTKAESTDSPSRTIQLAIFTDKSTANRKDFDYEFVHWMDFDFEYSARSIALDIAKRRIFAQAIAILASGKIPDKLPLKGVNAIDPTTDQPLHYQRTSNGFQIYAVGKSGVDHGGVRAGERRDGKYISSDKADILFSYPYRKPVTPLATR